MGGTVSDGWSWTNVCDGPGWTPARSGVDIDGLA